MNLNQLAGLSLALFGGVAAQAAAPQEADFYRIITLPTPDKVMLEAGALEFLPNGRLAISSRIGDIWILDNPLEDPPAHLRYHLFASGLHEVLGLAWHDGALYAVQRPEVTRIRDLDGDGRADLFETVSDAWGISGDYHEYAFGSKFDSAGDLWVALTLTGSFTSEAPFRGWCLRVSPDGRTLPACSGLRSPGGIGANCQGDLFFTDNQGPWNGACSLKQLVPGAFEGHPAGNIWYQLTDAIGPRPPDPRSGSRMWIEARRIPEYMMPAIIFPYGKMGQSASGFACSKGGGRFGPFDGQLFVGDQTHSTVMRVGMEEANDRYQGACFMFRQGFASGNLALEFAPDGSLFVYGTDRGWGARGGKPFALQRLVWEKKVPFEVKEMRAKPDGFELTFTKPVEPASAASLKSYQIETYTYIFQSSYGSPEVDRTYPTIKSAEVSPDGLSAHLLIEGLQVGHVHELHLPGVRSAEGEALLHPAAYYTLNFLPAK